MLRSLVGSEMCIRDSINAEYGEIYKIAMRRSMSILTGPPPIQRRRVVVTGLGAVTPLGSGVEPSWTRLLAGESGVGHITAFDASQLPCHIAAEVKRGEGEGEFDPDKIRSRGMKTAVTTSVEFALWVADEALRNAGWRPDSDEERFRTGVAFGSCIPGIEDIAVAGARLSEAKYRRISPHLVPRVLTNTAAGYVSIQHKLWGPNLTASTACASGSNAIGEAYRAIMLGIADVMVAGGAEAAINDVTIAGFCRMKALCTSQNEQPELASRPFDRARDGFVAGEGAGALVLEEMEHAQARGANILAELRGYGCAGDGHHITAPEGRGARRAMLGAMQEGGVPASSVEYVNAHATSTPSVSYTHLRAHETPEHLVCRLLLEKKKKNKT
eukprot:TRINITY_DN3342_c0_g1_i7.p1 TRINITY_DN3342_c0_g1~~TRINITY_DN3342_c0_g1_i7.p1  ORF type:complete len:386 (+),score=83.65 TRINITY_DN3342_c0_g1_i7:158-1315(+)